MSEAVVVFGSIIVIVGMVLTYRLLTLILEKKHGITASKPGRHTHHQDVDSASWQDLAERAESLNKRLQNLEEILLSDAEKEEEKVP